ncbi:MAG: hypothetical protein OXI96_05365 [Acidimicrobiaceae bacterium]|nr:hypothetical protein [Acidimicrobiaceae bacterium]
MSTPAYHSTPEANTVGNPLTDTTTTDARHPPHRKPEANTVGNPLTGVSKRFYECRISR